MLTFRKPTRFLYPVRLVFFPHEPDDLQDIMPWEVVQCKQVDADLLGQLASRAVAPRPYHTLVSDLSRSEERLWKGIEHSRRSQILKGEGMAGEVRVNSMSFDEVFTFLTDFARTKKMLPPYAYYIRCLLHHSDTLVITYDGQPAVLHLILRDFPRRAMAIYSAHNVSLELDHATRGLLNAALHWWEMQHYRAEGFADYDWGGVVLDERSPLYGITRFKSRFGGELEHAWDLTLLGDWLWPAGVMARAWQERHAAKRRYEESTDAAASS
jgi:hypothetical protein